MIAPFCQFPTPLALPAHRFTLPTRMPLGTGWGSWCPASASRCGFGIAGKEQLPHLQFSAVRGWHRLWPPSLAEPPLALLPGSVMAPSPVLAERSLLCSPWKPPEGAAVPHGRGAPVPTATSSACTSFQASLLQAVRRPRHGQCGYQPCSWQESSWLGILQGITPGDGKGLLWPLSLWKKKTPGQVLFVCFSFTEGKALLWSPYGLPCASSLVTVL